MLTLFNFLAAASGPSLNINFTNQQDSGVLQGPFCTPNDFITLILQALMILAVIAVLIMLLWGSIEYITSGGEKGKTEAARNKISGSIIGLFVLASVVAIFNLIVGILHLDLQLDKSVTGNTCIQTNAPAGANPNNVLYPAKPA